MNTTQHTESPSADVVISGAGPNGLLLAAELALAGIHPIVLEREPVPPRVPKANGLVGRVVQALDYRGLHELLADGQPIGPTIPSFPFAAFNLDLTLLGADNPMRALPIPQAILRDRLAAHLADLGVTVREGHELVDFTQDTTGVHVDVHAADGDYRVDAGYLVGADGGRSPVRKRLGIDFPGSSYADVVSRTGEVILPAEITGQGTHRIHIPGVGEMPVPGFLRTDVGVLALGGFIPGRYGLTVMETGQHPGTDYDPDAPLTIEELRAAARRVLGVDLDIVAAPPIEGRPPLWRRLTGLNSRQAERYRDGRVLLLGDAAHVHSGVGGPGLNLGMQDALNLGWKLAATVRGWAPEGLLDTYQSERFPVGERVLMQTRAQMALLAPGPDVTGLRRLLGELLTERAVVARLADTMSGADVHYTPGAHPLVGRWMPDIAVTTAAGGTRIAELVRAARPVLLELSGATEVLDAARPWAARVDLVAGKTSDARGGLAAVVIRPDGYVAWASAAPGGTIGLTDALRRWFGEPRPHGDD